MAEIQITKIRGAWRSNAEDLPRPDWETIGKWIEKNLPDQDQWHEAYAQLSRQWLETLAEHLEGEYGVYSSSGFILLTSLPPRQAAAVLQFCEEVERLYGTELPDVAQMYGYGPEAIVMFEELDDYARYIAAWYLEQEAAQYMGTGVHLTDPANSHIALARQHHYGQIEQILAHELAHACLHSLCLPRWLDEGVAIRLERLALSGDQEPRLDAEAVLRQRQFWNSVRIQEFWSGVSFLVPGKSAERSYLLADVLVSTIARNSRYLCDFVGAADAEDGGQAAALEHLGLSLGQIAAMFLEDGNWEPDLARGSAR